MAEHDVIITEFMDTNAVEDLRRDFRVHYDPKLPDKPDELARLVVGARALIVRNRTQVRGPLLAAADRLEAVGRLGVGLDNIDTEECARRSIKVFPATGANTVSVAEYVIAGMLVALRDVWHANAAVLAGQWPRNDLMFNEAWSRTLGLVGFGGIARAVAARARTLEMAVCAYDPVLKADDPAWREHGAARCATLDELLAKADVISLHTPLLPATRNLLSGPQFARMKKHAIVINTARGGIIDEPALCAALREGQIKAAVLDVFEQEPLKAGSIFEGVPNLYLTPHVAGVTEEGNVRVSSVTARNVRIVLKGA